MRQTLPMWIALVSCLPLVTARGAEPTRPANAGAVDRVVDLFPALKSGQIAVRYRPRDEKSAQVQIRNVSDRPLTVRLPEVFAARPVLAQIFPPTRTQSPRPQQTVAGPFPNNSVFPNNGPNNQPGNNFFNQFSLPPERLVEFEVQSVCLEYGSPTPNPGTRYELTPLDEVLPDATMLRQALVELRDKKLTHSATQAVAWHTSELSGFMSWQSLADLKGELSTTGRRPYFSARDLNQARQLVARATKTPLATTDSQAFPNR